jgi:aspartyl-tRNA(Asn)/glutamyl-tRNA(Gln) amidotransferase subunit A
VDLARRIRRGDVSPVSVVEATFDRIDERDDVVNAFVHTRREAAREEARAAERAVDEGDPLGPLHGVPVALKDLDTEMAGVPCTFGSRPFRDHVAEETSAIVQRLLDAGAIVVGTTNTPEMGHKGTCDNPLFPTTTTPFDPSKTAGGSSGGSAAAVAAGMVPIALGSDAGGSIRIPASCCGTYGLKPTWGLVPFDYRPDGLAHYAPFTCLGGLTRSVEDTALLLDVVAGQHPDDPVSVPDDGLDYFDAIRRPVDDLSVAYSPGLGVFPVDEEVESTVENVVDALEREGATVERVDPPFEHDREELRRAEEVGFETLMATLAEEAKAEGVDLLADHRDEMDAKVVELMENGYQHASVDYKAADEVRTAAYDALQSVFADYDLVLAATIAVPPFDVGTFGPTEVAGEEIDPHLGWLITFVCNLTGHPAASVPAGLTDGGLPVGAQLVGERFADDTVLAASAAVERRAPWAGDYPYR